MENFIIPGSEEIKQTIINITKLACIVKFDTYLHHDKLDDRLIEISTMDCKRQISKKIEDFVKIEVDRNQGKVFGVIHLPYIATEEMKNLNNYNSTLQDRIIGYQQEIMRLKFEIKTFNELPWWKRIWLK